MNWRELHQKTASAQTDLADEREVLTYLQSKGQDGAARRVQENIIKMEARIEKYRKEAS